MRGVSDGVRWFNEKHQKTNDTVNLCPNRPYLFDLVFTSTSRKDCEMMILVRTGVVCLRFLKRRRSNIFSKFPDSCSVIEQNPLQVYGSPTAVTTLCSHSEIGASISFWKDTSCVFHRNLWKNEDSAFLRRGRKYPKWTHFMDCFGNCSSSLFSLRDILNFPKNWV